MCTGCITFKTTDLKVRVAQRVSRSCRCVDFPLQACLAWWNVVSPFGGWGSTLALLFVLVVAAIKAVWEDFKRHQEDHNTNGSVAHRYMPDGTLPLTSLNLAGTVPLEKLLCFSDSKSSAVVLDAVLVRDAHDGRTWSQGQCQTESGAMWGCGVS